MANYVNGNINIVSLNSTILTQNYYPIRNILSKIPPTYQTDELTKFFNSSVNYWFTPGESTTYNGYIGKLTEWYNPNTDNYITEPSSEREFYQLDPSISIRNENNEITQVITYTDIINTLNLEGCDVRNQDKLFNNEYYSWCPPIDIDKFINYGNYYWVSDINNYFLLTGIQEKYYIKSKNLPDKEGYTSISNTVKEIALINSNVNVMVNDNIIPDALYTISNNILTFNEFLNIGDTVTIIYQSNIDSDLIGKTNIEDPSIFGLDKINNGMRILVLNDKNQMYNNEFFIIEGVDASIDLIQDSKFDEIIGQSIEYSYNTDTNEYFIDKSMYVDGMTKDNIKIYINGTLLPKTYFLYDGVYTVKINKLLNPDCTVVLYSPSNIKDFLNENVTNIYGINIRRNQVINITNDINNEYDGLYLITFNSDLFNITPYNLYYDADYITIEKGTNNPWSNKNRWFHKDNINIELDSSSKATRPILEYSKNLELYNYGSYRRIDVDLINTNKSNIGSFDSTTILGVIDGVRVDQDYIITNGGYVRILLTKDVSNDFNNKIISVYFDTISQSIKVDIMNDGQNQTGSPVTGEIVKIISGNNSNNEYWFNGNNWVEAQSKSTFPLFDLYDENGIKLNDANTYPNSSFDGNKIFSYIIGSGTDDTILGFPLDYNSDGNILFENYIFSSQYSYKENNIEKSVSTPYFYNNNGLENSWHKNDVTLRQSLTNTYVFDGIENSIKLGCPTFDSISIDYVNVEKEYPPYVSTLTDNQYTIDGDILTLNFTPNNNDKLVITSTCFDIPMYGLYNVPSCLQTNPDNEMVEEISYNECFDQFNKIINSSNWLTSTPDYSKGTDIILQLSDMMTLGLLSSDNSINFISSSEYVKNEYTKYKSNFQKLLYSYYTTSKFKTNATIEEMCQTIVSVMSQGKNTNGPFSNTNFGKTSTYTQNTYIPETPSMSGLYEVFTPQIIDDRFLPVKENGCYQTFIQCHDGSLVLTFGDYTLEDGVVTNVNYNAMDYVILELENRIYNSINTNFIGTRPVSDYIKYKPGFFRNTIYTVEQYNTMMKPFFDKWCSKNGLDYKTNNNKSTENNKDNPFEWNWSYYSDINGNDLHGSYRSIFDYYYDTCTPSTTPWEMLGFGIKPTWWDTEYGVAPYTSNNYKLWTDLENGYVRQGSRQGIQADFSRPGLLDIIPVDEFGDLMNPASIGLVKQFVDLPSGNVVLGNQVITGWNDDWNFGDYGPVETMWRNSSEYPFSVVQTFYKEKPAMVINDLWDTTNISNIFVNRLAHSDIYINNEIINGTLISKTGINAWISDYLKYQGKNVTTYLGNKIRNMTINLSHRFAGYTKEDELVVYSDVYGEIPSQNTNVILHKGPIGNPVYSGVTIVYTNQKYKIYGFDKVNSYFSYYDVDENSMYSNVNTPNTNTATFKSWTKNTYYSINTVVTYKGLWFICNQSHTSSSIFEDVFWDKTNKPNINNSIYGKWFSTTKTLLTLNYGDSLSSIQDVINFLNGLQAYYESNGWVFNSTNFKDIANQFLSWANINQYEGAFISLSPYQDKVTYGMNSGIVGDLTYPNFEMYDIFGNSIDNFISNRTQTSLTIQAENIFYCKLSVYVYEHIMVLDNTTIYGNKIYAPEINVIEERLLVDGFVTSNWNGTLNAPGFIVTGNTIIPNFEKTVDNFRKYFDIETIDNADIQLYARKNIGFSKKDYLTKLHITDTNQFEFYQGMIKQKGTESSFSKLLRSSAISNNENIQFSEEWALRLSYYGNTQNKKTIELSIDNTDITFDPQIIEFTQSEIDPSFIFEKSFENESQVLISNDSSDAELMTTSTITPSGIPTSTILEKLSNAINLNTITITVTTTDLYGTVSIKGNDTYLIESYPLQNSNSYTLNTDININEITVIFQNNSVGVIDVKLNGIKTDIELSSPKSDYISIFDVINSNDNSLYSRDSHWLWRYDIKDGFNWDKTISKPLLSTAGYVNVDNMNYFCNTRDDLINLIENTMDKNPSVVSEYTTSFNYDGISTSPSNVTNRIAPNFNDKSFNRVNTITVNLVTPLPNNGLEIIVRTKTETISTILSENLTVGDNVIRPYKFINLNNTANAIYVDFNYQGISPIGYDISDITVTVELEEFDIDTIQPNKSAWVYNDQYGSWSTYKLQDTNLEISKIYVPSFTGQGSVVCLGTIPKDIQQNDLVWISSSKSDSNSGDMDQFDYNTFNIKISNSRTLTITNNATGSYDLLQELSDAGMIIDSITINNTSNIDVSTEPTVITIGTDSNNESVVTGFVPDSAFTESNVMLYCDCLCENTETSAPTEGTSVVTSTSCFDTNGIINVSLSNTSIVLGDSNTTIPVQITRTGDIFNTITSVTVTNGGSGYTSIPDVTIVGASGYTATATISNGSVASVTISNTGGCSLPLDTNPSIVISGGGGTGATATPNVTNIADEPTVVGWKYRDVTNNGGYIVGGTITFPVITDSTGNDFWSQIVNFQYPELLTSSNKYEIVIYDVNNMGYNITNASTNITIYNDSNTDTSFDLSKTGQKTFTNITPQDNDELIVYVTNDGKTSSDCNISITVNYHYINGFELFLNSTPFVISDMSYGGSLLKWKNTRVNSLTNVVNPDNNWTNGDYLHVDNSGNWVVYEYNNGWVEYFSYVNNYVDNSIFDSAILYTDDSSEQFTVYDPLQNIIPGNIDKNITFKSKIDPAKYNSTNSNEKHCWTNNYVGKTWWDLSSTYYVDYTLYGINYTRNHWGEVVPNCNVSVYEWVRSPVSPDQWSSYINSGKTTNGFDSNPSGSVDSTTIPYTQTSEWNTSINAFQDVYYFWVNNKTTLPLNNDRKMTCSQIINYIKNIKDYYEPFCALSYGNRVILGNINKKIKSSNSSLKLSWLSESNLNQDHSEWVLIRENDTINSIDSNVNEKIINSITGFKKIENMQTHSSITMTPITINSTSVELENTDGLLYSGDIKIGNYWFSYSSIRDNTLYGLVNPSNVKLDKNQITYSKNIVYDYIQVPDVSLTEKEQFGSENVPLQSIVPNVNGVPSRIVRQTLIETINSILLKTNYVDNISNWNLVFNQTESEPLLYNYKVGSIDELSSISANLNETVLVEAGTSTNNMWVLYSYDPYNSSSNSYGFKVIDSQKWNIEEGYIWNYANWYADGWDSSLTPQYIFTNMSEKNNANIPDNTLLNGTLVQVNQISNNDSRWIWQVYKDGSWSNVAIQNGTFALTDVFYESSTVYGLKDFNISDIPNRDGSFELDFLMRNLNQIFTTQQMNSLIFAIFRSVLNCSEGQNDWLMKTSYMYIDGYQEQMNMTEVVQESPFDNIIEYIEEVKPYHVKIRDYLIQYVPEIEYLNCGITDFDFPSNNGTILHPYTEKGTNGYSNNNSDDTITVTNNKPWSDWYSNYTNPLKNVNEWSANWNGVRTFNITMKFDNIGINRQEGWDVTENPWDYNVETYSGNKTVSDLETLKSMYNINTDKITKVTYYYELNDLLLNSDFDTNSIVFVELKNKYYFFNGIEWIEFYSGPWDKAVLNSAYDRIVNLYKPTSTMNKDPLSLTNGDYKGTIWFAGNFSDGDWDEYAWDWYGGFNAETSTYTGYEDDLSSDTIYSNFDGYISNVSYNSLSRDMDAIGPSLDSYAISISSNEIDQSGYGVNDIIVWGSLFRDPEIEEGNTSEKVELNVTSSIIIRINDETSNITFFKDYNDLWYVENSTNKEKTNLNVDMKYNTGYSTIQNFDISNPTEVFLTYNIDMTNIVEIKKDVVLYDGENYIQYGNDIEYVIPTIKVVGDFKNTPIPSKVMSESNSLSVLSNNKSYYWINNEIISAEYTSIDENGNTVMYKVNRYLYGTSIPEISKNAYNEITDTDIVYNSTTKISACDFSVSFNPKNNVGFYNVTNDGIGLFGITLVGE